MSETLSEDTVYSFMYPISPLNDVELEELCAAVNKTIQTLSLEYIWHKEEFRVHIPIIKRSNELGGHLIGITYFGDNIEDEWFIVKLLFEISRHYPNLIIQVYDNDGEFLLIEAADYLPPWANPDNTQNRVFIIQGNMHLIPPSILEPEGDVGLSDAIKVMLEFPALTQCPAIEQAVLKRIDEYPNIPNQNIHRAVINLPLDIATLLTLKPSLISPIVTTYCNHDVIDAKACRNVKLENCVQIQVKFTKCLYAMLTHSKLVKTVKLPRIHENDKKVSLGLKITCGYEMIMAKLSVDMFSSKQFSKFLKSLTDNGYFKENIEGSKDYKILLEKAKNFFLAMECPTDTHICNQITQLLKSQEFENMKEKLKNTPIGDLADDADDWMNISPDQLNEMLNTRYGQTTKFKSNDILNSATITSELSDFFKKTSDFEGIETEMDDDEDNTINFNSEEFMDSLNKMMNFLATGESDDDMNIEFDDSEDELEKELKEKLHTDDKIGSQDTNLILQNMIKSMKEEEGSSGPSSNILRSIGIHKTDILDSDDDE